MKVTIAQLNPTIGDLQGNLNLLEKALKQIESENTDLVIFPELFLSGYPPQDLLERKAFIHYYQKTLKCVMELSSRYPQTGILCGNIRPTEKDVGKELYNTAVLIQDGEIRFEQKKTLLPTYDVFDEARYFEPASDIDVFKFKNEQLGITICEDAWNVPELFPQRIYRFDPVAFLAQKGATLLINISASPFGIGKEEVRYDLFRHHASKYKIPFILVNQVGANDEIISDGRSMIFDEQGNLLRLFPAFEERVETIDLKNPPPIESFKPLDEMESVENALTLGIRDYTRKCGFQKVVLGLSGGIDSALTCVLACRALGAKNVLAIAMPSPYSSKESVEDARKLANTLKVVLKIIPITSLYEAYLQSLNDHFAGTNEDETEENIQARIRGNIIMALSNKFGYLPLASGNKSELSVGYCTLYGDMSGGLGVLADVPKTMVYHLSRYINRNGEIIPENIMVKVPSAELKPGQRDEDTLPPYDVLDRILHLYIDRGSSRGDIISEGIASETVDWVINAVNKNEYKRRQAAPGLKITTKAFGTGRRMPMAAKIMQPINPTSR